MNATEALALHQQVQSQQQTLIAALGCETPDMEECLDLSTVITNTLTTIPPANKLINLTDHLREELLKSARITAHLLQRYQNAVMQLRQQHTESQARVERDGAAIRRYRANAQATTAAEPPRFLDEKR
jgi:hypothetical protein